MSRTYSHLEVVQEPGIQRFTLTRAAIDLTLAAELRTALAGAESDPDCRAVVIDARGRFFCAGGDVKAMVAASNPANYVAALAGELHAFLISLSESRLISVAVVQGPAAGAGLGLVLNADIAIATPKASFIGAYGSVGLTPDCGVSFLLPAVIGPARAAQILLAGRTVQADEAADWGLVSEVVQPEDLEQAVSQTCAMIVKGLASTNAHTKRLLNSTRFPGYREHLRDEASTIALMSARDDSLARLQSFAGSSGTGRGTKNRRTEATERVELRSVKPAEPVDNLETTAGGFEGVNDISRDTHLS